jgi:hypothetical protein
LFRKPFKNNLRFVTWLFADEDDFFTKLRISPPELFDERKISPERRVERIRLAIKSMDYTQVLDVSEFLDVATIYGMVAVVSPKGVLENG